MDEKSTAEQRRTDLLERLRMRFYQYQRRQSEYMEKYVRNGPYKDDRERQESQMYQQRIMSMRANGKNSKVKQEPVVKGINAEANAFGGSGGEQAYILQHLKRTFDESFNRHSHENDHENDETVASKAARTSNGEDGLVNAGKADLDDKSIVRQNLQDSAQFIDLKASGPPATSLSMDQQSSVNQRHSQDPSSSVASDGRPDSRSNSVDLSHEKSSNAPASGINCAPRTSKASMDNIPVVIPKQENQSKSCYSECNEKDVLPNGMSNLDESLTYDLVKDLADFDDVLRNISSNDGNTSGPTTSSSDRSTSKAPVVTVKEEPVPAKISMSKSKNSSDQSGDMFQGRFPSPMSNNMKMVGHNMSTPMSSPMQRNPPMLMTPQSLSFRPQITDNMIQGKASLRGTVPNVNMSYGSAHAGGRDVPPQSTRSQEIVEKLHLYLAQQHIRKQRQQVDPTRQHLHQQMQQPYQQQLMQMAQAAQQQHPAPRVPSMSPHMQQGMVPQVLSSPMGSSPMVQTPQMNPANNPFQFPAEYSTYMKQQSQISQFDNMGLQPPPSDGGMPGFYNQQEQQHDANSFSVGPQMMSPTHPGASQTQMGLRGAFANMNQFRERMMSPEMLQPGNPMQSHLVPPGFQQGRAMKQTMMNFSTANSLDSQQMSMNNGGGRLSHYPEEQLSGQMQNRANLKASNSMSMFPNPMMSSMLQNQQSNQASTRPRIMDNSLPNFGNNYPPNFPMANAASNSRNMGAGPGGGMWGEDFEMSKQMVRQGQNFNMDYRSGMNGPNPAQSSGRPTMGPTAGYSGPFSPLPGDHSLSVSASAPGQANSYRISKHQQNISAPKVSLNTPDSLDVNTSRQRDSEDLENLLSNPPENFDLLKMLGP